ncbi:MAG: Grx4 family monothiol glutaredoxin [Oscillatoria sp. SIO1A7]|nr:Grx4 family monothiol glutaredoxin [Oscillatoria sp. SIO1A7]
MTTEVQSRIKKLVEQNKVLLFMKGNKMMPQCGFSNNAVQILNALTAPYQGFSYETVDVLEDYDIRQGIKEYSNWPTIPQLYIDGEFIGGSDIMVDLYNKGELEEKLTKALAS